MRRRLTIGCINASLKCWLHTETKRRNNTKVKVDCSIFPKVWAEQQLLYLHVNYVKCLIRLQSMICNSVFLVPRFGDLYEWMNLYPPFRAIKLVIIHTDIDRWISNAFQCWSWNGNEKSCIIIVSYFDICKHESCVMSGKVIIRLVGILHNQWYLK